MRKKPTTNQTITISLIITISLLLIAMWTNAKNINNSALDFLLDSTGTGPAIQEVEERISKD